MKELPPNESDAQLGALLKEWKVTETLPPRFQERVWTKLTRLETQSRPGGRFSLTGLLETLARPRLAASYLGALLLLGFTAGWLQGVEKSAQIESKLSTRYLQVVNPFQNSNHSTSQ